MLQANLLATIKTLTCSISDVSLHRQLIESINAFFIAVIVIVFYLLLQSLYRLRYILAFIYLRFYRLFIIYLDE